MDIQTTLSVLQGVGIVVAILDFTGWSKKLKNFLDRLIFIRFLDWLMGKGHEGLIERIGPYISAVAYGLFFLAFYAWVTEWEYLPYFLGSSLFLFYVPILVIMIGIPMFYNFLRLISFPPSGILGTIGLFGALASLVLGHFIKGGC